METAFESPEPGSDLLHVMGHEMRSTLQSLVLGVDIADRLAESDCAAVHRHLKYVHANAMMLSRLVADLLENAHAVMRVNLASCDVAGLVRDAVEMFEGLEAHQAVLDLPRELPSRADPDRVRQIVRNILSNAEKYSTPGTIHIGAVRENRYTVVTFRDEGPGIAENDQLKLFKRRMRLPSKREGMGVGLWLSQQLARAMNGELWVESCSGGPTTFFLALPAQT